MGDTLAKWPLMFWGVLTSSSITIFFPRYSSLIERHWKQLAPKFKDLWKRIETSTSRLRVCLISLIYATVWKSEPTEIFHILIFHPGQHAWEITFHFLTLVCTEQEWSGSRTRGAPWNQDGGARPRRSQLVPGQAVFLLSSASQVVHGLLHVCGSLDVVGIGHQVRKT